MLKILHNLGQGFIGQTTCPLQAIGVAITINVTKYHPYPSELFPVSLS